MITRLIRFLSYLTIYFSYRNTFNCECLSAMERNLIDGIDVRFLFALSIVGNRFKRAGNSLSRKSDSSLRRRSEEERTKGEGSMKNT